MKQISIIAVIFLLLISMAISFILTISLYKPQAVLPVEFMENNETIENSNNLDENGVVNFLFDDIVGFRFDGFIDCDLNGDGEIERVTLFTGGNNVEIERGWDLGAHVIIEEKTHQIWFNSVGSVKSATVFTFHDERQGVLVVVYGNVGDTLYLLFFEEGELSVQLLLGTP